MRKPIGQQDTPDWSRQNASPATVRRLVYVRLVRSIGQGALSIDFVLYSRALDWSPAFLGAVIAAGLLLNALATGIVGPLSDRLGRKPFILGYEALACGAALVAVSTAARWPLAGVAILAGWGRGSNSAPGLFGVVEQAWLARAAPREQLARSFARFTAAGFFGLAIGSALAALPSLGTMLLPGPLAYRPLFALTAATEAVSFILLAGTDDHALPALLREPQEEKGLRRQEHGLLVRLAGLNSLNGLGIGLGGPLITWWFAQRYGVGPAAIGPAIGATLIFSAASALSAGWFGTRFGAVRVVVAMRGIAVALLVVLPFAPNYPTAMLVYALRMVLNRGTAGPRQALALGLVRAHRRGLAATVSSFSTQLPRALGPFLTGVLFAAGSLAAPFLFAAFFQGAYLVFYPRLFSRFDLDRTSRR